jgi:beta-lactamase regulating signal transducer with metallopeptidase domain
MAATVLWWLAQNALVASILAGLVALACRWGRFRPAVQHGLWLLVLIKLVTPPLPLWSWTPPPEWRTPDANATAALGPCKPVSDDAITSQSGLSDPPGGAPLLEITNADANPEDVPATDCTDEPAPIVTLDAAEPESETPAQVGREDAPSRTRWINLPFAAWWTWLGGMAAMAALQIVRLVRLRRLLASGQSPSPDLVRNVAELAARLGVQPPTIVMLHGIGSPRVCGLGRPMLMWPIALQGQLSDPCQRAVIVHELAHLRRRDHWVAWLQVLAGCVWWWNPLYWYVCWQLGRASELACDAWVIGTLPDARRSYAEALLAVAQFVSETAMPTPALGISGAGRQDFRRRLTMIMCERVPYRFPVFGVVVLGLLALAVLPGWSLGQRPAGPALALPMQPAAASADANHTPVAVDYGLQPSTTPKPAPAERERKLQELEQKVQKILKEIQSLRGTRPAYGSPGWVSTPSATPNHAPFTNFFGQSPYMAAGSDSQQITLTRATYKLPREKAAALSAFLREHVKAMMMESKVDGDSLIVTTTPDAQRTIGQFIALMKSKPESPKGGLKPIDGVDAPSIGVRPIEGVRP